jgi:acyl carrier protein
MGSVELLLQLESAYDIVVPDEALTKENLETPAALWRVIESLIGVDAPQGE